MREIKRGITVAERPDLFNSFPFTSVPGVLENFMMGKIPNRLEYKVDGRYEFKYRHATGFNNRRIKVVSIGAHPDDTALSCGLEYLLVRQGMENGERNTGLSVITATTGIPEQADDFSRFFRIDEDIMATAYLNADLYFNLGFQDGKVPQDYRALGGRLAQYLKDLQPDVVILPDPMDPVHMDHIAVANATISALERNKQLPIVVYTDHQNGRNTLTEGNFGFALDQFHYDVFKEGFFKHRSQTQIITPDVEAVIQRPIINARTFYPDVPYLGIGRQDMRFSSQPISDLLRDKAINLSEVELLDLFSAEPTLPFTIYVRENERYTELARR